MFILNATKEVRSIMSDNGTIITINPGEVSQLIIASKNQIRAALNLGTPKEIGIILDGSYDLALAKDISGAQPYLYTDIEEAKSKLIDPSIDYKAKLAGNLEVDVLRRELEAKEYTIKGHQATIAALQAEISKLKAEDIKIELENKLREFEIKYREVENDKVRLNSQLTDTQEQLRLMNDTVSNLRKELGIKDQEMTSLNKMLQDKVDELDILKSNSAQNPIPDPSEYVTMSEYNRLKTEFNAVSSSVESYKTNLSEASDTIESMKTAFNEACEKFHITRDEAGNWIQLEE